MTSAAEFQAQCDTITGTLPHFSDRFAEMSRDTQDMAEQLEERMRFLEDGYEHLGAVAGQIPQAFQELASGHRKGIMEAAQVLEIDDKENESVLAQQLNYLKRELHSIAQERVVVDVFTRGTISRAKQHFKTNKGSKEAAGGETAVMDHDRARSGAISSKRGGDSSGLASTRAVRAATEGENAPSLLQTRKAEESGEGQDGQYNHGIRGGNAFTRMTRGELMSSIILPAFGQNWTGGAAASAAVARNFGMEPPQPPSTEAADTVQAAPHRAVTRAEPRGPPIIRRVRPGAVMVPSMKHGLPEEISNLKFGAPPVDAPYDLSTASSATRRAARTAKASADTMKSTIIPVAKALRAELRRNKAEMDTLRNEVHEVHKDMQAERVAARRVMRTVAAGLESHMASTEENIKCEVQAVVDGAFDRLTGTLLQIEGRKDYAPVPATATATDEQHEVAPVPVLQQALTRHHQYHHTVPESAQKEKEEAHHPVKADPVHQFLTQQKQKIQYDRDGRKIVRQSRPRMITTYDLDGHPVHKQRGGGGGAAKPGSPAQAARLAPERGSSPTPTPVHAKSPKHALSPQGRVVVDTEAGASGGSPRSSSSPAASSKPPHHSFKPVPAPISTNVPAADAETFTDPATGTVYKVLGVSAKGHIGGKRSTGTGVFWGRQRQGQNSADTCPNTPVPGATAPTTAAATAASPGPARTAGEPFVKTLSIYHPVAVPRSKEEQAIQDTHDANQAKAQVKKDVQSVQEYSLVLGPSGVAWQATKVPTGEFEHPDVQASRLGGGGGPNPQVSNFLRREVVPGDVQHPGPQTSALTLASEASAGEHTKQQMTMLTNALGVVEGGGREVVIKGTTTGASNFVHDTHDQANQLRLHELMEGAEEGEDIGAEEGQEIPRDLSSIPLHAPPRPAGLPHPDINVFVASKSHQQKVVNQNQYGQTSIQLHVPGSASLALLEQQVPQPAAINRDNAVRTTSVSETPRAIHGTTLTSESSEVYTAFTPDKTTTTDTIQSELPTEDRAVRPVSMLTQGNLKIAGSAELAAVIDDGTDGGTAEEVQTLESLGDSKDGGFGAFDDASSDGGGGEVKLSSSAIDDNSAVYTRPISPRTASPTAQQQSPQSMKFAGAGAEAEAGAGAGAGAEAGGDERALTDKNSPLKMKPLQSSLGQKLVQVVPVLQKAVTASAEARAPQVVSAQVAFTAPAVPQQQQQMPTLLQSSSMPAPQEFAMAMMDALRALTSTVAPPQVTATVASSAAAPPAVSEALSAEVVRRGIEAGIESGVSKVLDGLKKRAAIQRARDQTEAARTTRIAAATARAGQLGGAGAGASEIGAVEAADAAAANSIQSTQQRMVGAVALPHGEVKMLDLGAKARPSHSTQKFAPLVSNIIGAQASMAAATLSIDSTSNDFSMDESNDTVERVFANVKLAPGLENIFTRDGAGAGAKRGTLNPENVSSPRNSLQQSYIFAGGDVSSSDDWTEVGGAGLELTDMQEVDDELDALAELSLRDDQSFVEALKGESGTARKLVQSPPKDVSLGQSADDNEIENITLD